MKLLARGQAWGYHPRSALINTKHYLPVAPIEPEFTLYRVRNSFLKKSAGLLPPPTG